MRNQLAQWALDVNVADGLIFDHPRILRALESVDDDRIAGILALPHRDRAKALHPILRELLVKEYTPPQIGPAKSAQIQDKVDEHKVPLYFDGSKI